VKRGNTEDTEKEGEDTERAEHGAAGNNTQTGLQCAARGIISEPSVSLCPLCPLW